MARIEFRESASRPWDLWVNHGGKPAEVRASAGRLLADLRRQGYARAGVRVDGTIIRESPPRVESSPGMVDLPDHPVSGSPGALQGPGASPSTPARSIPAHGFLRNSLTPAGGAGQLSPAAKG